MLTKFGDPDRSSDLPVAKLSPIATVDLCLFACQKARDHKKESMPAMGAMSTTNKTILAASALLLCGAVGYTLWQEQGGASTPSAMLSTDAGGDVIAALEQQIRDNPDNAETWSALANARFDQGQFSAAAESYQKATSLSPRSAGLWSAYGESLVMASTRDPMPAAAAAAFEKAITLDPKEPRARYFMAVKKDLSGDHQGAINDWFALLADTPAGAPWEADLRRTIEQVGAIHKIDVAPRLAAIKAPAAPPLSAQDMPVAARAIPGPTRADMEAASQLPKGQQDAMIDGMIASLESKIAANPQNVDQWIMLMRSRMTLGETNKAAKALQNAVAANPAAAARLRAQAKLLAVPGA